ncbi:hypothetical protein [Bacillus weihaiensis]|nr:hypothetical protein [Bacillus weihaiensis]
MKKTILNGILAIALILSTVSFLQAAPVEVAAPLFGDLPDQH